MQTLPNRNAQGNESQAPGHARNAVGFRALKQGRAVVLPNANSVVPDTAAEREKHDVTSIAHETNTHESLLSVPDAPRDLRRSSISKRSAPPLPKKKKGSFFIGTIFVTAISVVGYLVFASFFKYQAYGVINGRLITVSAPWDGVVTNWQVRDGDLVSQNQVLATISNLRMQHQLESLRDEMSLTQAELEAELSRLRLSSQARLSDHQKAVAEYLQISGQLEEEKSSLDVMQSKLVRAQRLIKSNNISRQKYEEIYYEFTGQDRKVSKLRNAVAVLKLRSEQTAAEDSSEQQRRIQPLIRKIEQTRAAVKRLREEIDMGTITAPVSGQVTKRFCLTGESVKSTLPILEILESNSTEAVLYLPQSAAARFGSGDTVSVELEPYRTMLECEVVRIGDQFEAPPQHISRCYFDQQFLLPVHLKPLPEYQQWMSLRINGTVKLPYRWQDRIAAVGSRANDWIHGNEPQQNADRSFDFDSVIAPPPPFQPPIENSTISQCNADRFDRIEFLTRNHDSESIGIPDIWRAEVVE